MTMATQASLWLSGTRPLGLAVLLGTLAMAAPVHAQTEVVLHSFARRTGDQPRGGVIRDSAGNLYGTAATGGAAGAGVVYKLDAGHRYTVLYNFMGGADGGVPSGSLLRDSAGNLYGTTVIGGNANVGVVYQIPPDKKRFCTASQGEPTAETRQPA
jgi:uncharacterized repeat protein (TIGR03803 family)